MFTYFFLAGIIIAMYFFVKYINLVDYKKNYNFLVAIFLILFLSLRSEKIGLDIATYSSFFESMGKKNFIDILKNSSFEVGYIFLNKIVYLLSFGNFRFLMIVISAFAVYSFAFCIDKYSPYPWISWLLYLALNFLIYPISGLRACIAMSFGLLAINYLFLPTNKKNAGMYYLFVVIAFLFHKTSVIYFVLYPLCKIKNEKIVYGALILLAVILICLGDIILKWLIQQFYPNYELKQEGGYGLFMFLAGCYMAGIIFVPAEKKKSVQNIVLFRIVFFCFVLQLATLRFSLFARIIEFTLIAVVLYIPYILFVMEEKYRRFGTIVVVCGALFLFYLNLSEDGAGIVPYMIFWE